MTIMKMTKLYSLALLLGSTLAFIGCAGEEDDLFDQSAAERLNAAKSVYSARLSAAPAGWTMEYYPTYDTLGFKAKGYLMLAQFKNDGSVRMAMQNAFSQNKYLEDTSLWEIVTDNGPELSFNSFNACLHAFSSPEDLPSSINDSGENVQGLGAEGDYEFVLVDVKEGASEINIKGKKRGTYVHMVKLDEGTDFQQYLNDINNLSAKVFNNSSITCPLLVVNGKKYLLTNGASGIIQMYPMGGDPVTETTNHAFILLKHGGQYLLRFRNPLTLGEAKLSKFAYNEDQQKFVSDDGTQATIEGYNPNEFFASWMKEGHKWEITQNSAMSGRFSELFEAILAKFKSLNYTMRYLQLSSAGDDKLQADMSISLKRGTRTVTVTFGFDYTLQEVSANHAVLVYQGVHLDENGSDSGAAAILTAVPELESLVNLLGSAWVAKSSASPFLLDNLNLTSENDANTWIRIQHK